MRTSGAREDGTPMARADERVMQASLDHLLALGGLGEPVRSHVRITGSGHVFPTRYNFVPPAAAVIAATGAAAAELWRMKTGRVQTVQVDARAAAAAMRGSRYLRIDGRTPERDPDNITGFYALRDGRWMYLHCHFPNLRDRNVAVLDVPPQRDAVSRAVATRDGLALEEAIFAAGGACGFVRSEAEWREVPQSRAVAQLPLLEIVRIGDAPPQPLPEGPRPLSGIRVLDLTRVLAGPTCARTLAEHGADVLRVTREDLPDMGATDFDTGIGKLSTHIDLRVPAEAKTMQQLVRDGDVFLQSYRPGALAGRGFRPDALARLRPGVIYVTLSAWGHAGPWSERRGYDTVVQAASGMAYHGSAAPPQFLPVSAQDYISGYLLAYGTMLALARRAREGGSWMVRTALASAGHWIRQHGLFEPAQYEALPDELPAEALRALLTEHQSPIGRLTHLAPVVQMSETPARWARPAVPRGTHPPVWPPREI